MTEGNLVTFESRNGTKVTIKHFMFGYSSVQSKGANRVSGILGLGQRASSLISLLNYTAFSYCIGNINDRDWFKHINFWRRAYNLGKISGGDKFLDINPRIFRRDNHIGGILIDSEASSTYLPDEALNKLKKEIRYMIDTTLKEHIISSRPDELCYHGSIIQDLKDLPTIVFYFVENAKIEFALENLFRQISEYFCLSVLIKCR